jgi:DNA helicase-2/ATP-dependent DNA helicase PcrA
MPSLFRHTTFQTPKGPYIPSELQHNFYDVITDTSESILLVAVAGSGKSTSIAWSTVCIPSSKTVQILMFGNRTAKDMKKKMEEIRVNTGLPLRHIRVSTFHGLGFSALSYWLRQRDIEVQDLDQHKHKVRNILKKKLSEADYAMYGTFVRELVGKAKGCGLGIPGMVDDVLDAWYEMIDHYGMVLDSQDAKVERAIDIARKTLRFSTLQAEHEGIIDFDDMLYCPLLFRCRFYPLDVIYGDEMQDTNEVRREIMRRALKPGGRVICVGDPKQSIFGFTGATNNAMELIKKQFKCREMMLNVSYRCPQVVAEQVKHLVPYFKVHEKNVRGDIFDVNLDELLPVLNERGDAILCRNVAPIVSLAFKLIARGKACHVLGSEIGKGLASLVKRMEADTIPALEGKIKQWCEAEVARHIANDHEDRAAAVQDKVDCILVMCENLPESMKSVDGLLKRIDALFQDEENTLCLSSIHKAKGREWDNVTVYMPELSPSPRAKKAWEMEQEENLIYVRDTRCTKLLMFLPEVK